MSNRLLYPLCVAGVILLNACGHSTLHSRIGEKQQSFVGLTPREQAMIKRGVIAVGFTADMVYMALAKPDRIVAGPGPMQETWLYQTFYAADGSSLTPGQKITSHWAEDTGGLGASAGPNGPVHRMPGTPPSAQAGWGGNLRPELVVTTIDYDPKSTHIREEAQTRVKVIFLRGVVADIQISQS